MLFNSHLNEIGMITECVNSNPLYFILFLSYQEAADAKLKTSHRQTKFYSTRHD